MLVTGILYARLCYPSCVNSRTGAHLNYSYLSIVARLVPAHAGFLAVRRLAFSKLSLVVLPIVEKNKCEV